MMALSLWLVCGAALLSAPYQTFVFTVEMPVCDVAARDVTGDGRAEIFVLCCDEDREPLEKFVQVFPADENGAYGTRASWRITLDVAASVLFFSETDGAAPPELVAADASGAAVYRFNDGACAAPERVVFTALLPTGSDHPTFLRDLAHDLDGDGLDEWILPTPSGYAIQTRDGVLHPVTCDVKSNVNPDETLDITFRIARCRPFALPGETRNYLALLSEHYVDFAHGPDWADHTRFKIPLRLDEKWESGAGMEDIDGNGFPDLVATQARGMINMKAVTHVYLASAAFTYPSTPSAVFETRSGFASPSVIDVDGDGKRDLVFVSIPMGVKNILNYFVRRKVSARLEVYRFADGAFPPKPTDIQSFTLDAPEGQELVAYTSGDFNGDGRADVAFASLREQLDIYAGQPGGMIATRPWATINLPAFGVARATDLNGNPARDILLFHPTAPNRKRIDVVVF